MAGHGGGLPVGIGQNDLDVEDGLRLSEDRSRRDESDRQEHQHANHGAKRASLISVSSTFQRRSRLFLGSLMPVSSPAHAGLRSSASPTRERPELSRAR